MAGLFSYDDFYKKAQDSGLLGQFSEADLRLAQQYPEFGMSALQHKIDYAGATTDEAKALIHSETESDRQKYGGYSGGADGSGYYATGSALSNTRDTELADLLNREPFSFDPAESQEYGAYKKQYLREGDRAESNALAQASALTGGMPSTAAVTAASQAGDYYAARLTDKLPEIYENEYNRYLNEYNMDLSTVGLLNGMEQDEYSRGVYTEETGYNRGIYSDELARSEAEADKELAQSEVMAMIEIGQMPTDEQIARSGLTRETVAAQVAFKANELAQKALGGGGGGSGSGPDEEEEEGTYTAAQRSFYDQVRTQLIGNFDPESSDDPYNLLQSSDIYKRKMGDYLYGILLKEAKNYSVGNYQPEEEGEPFDASGIDWEKDSYYIKAKALLREHESDYVYKWILDQPISDDMAAALVNYLGVVPLKTIKGH